MVFPAVAFILISRSLTTPLSSGVKLVLQERPIINNKQAGLGIYSLTFINDGKEDFAYHDSNFWGTHLVKLVDSHGGEPPMTAFGKEVRDEFWYRFRRANHNFRIVLKPGQSKLDSFVGNLEKLYDLVPGKYMLTVTYCCRGDDGVTVTSSPVPFVEPDLSPRP